MKAAIVLCGCGRADGSEIHESVACLIHLSRLGVAYRCFAPDADQAEVVNHLTGERTSERRNMLVESARIARGEVSPLSELRASDFDAVVFPGGFGAAKNLCTFARDGAECEVRPDVAEVVRAFHAAGKPVGMCCIAPVIGAKVLGTAAGGPGVTVTLGDDAGAAGAVRSWGSKHVVKPVTEAAVDREQRVATSPAYMYGKATPHEVYEGIGRMIEGVVELARLRR